MDLIKNPPPQPPPPPPQPSRPPMPVFPQAGAPPPPGTSFPTGASIPVPQVSLGSLRFRETEPYEKGFADYFEEKIKPRLKELEQERLNKLAELEKLKPKANLVLIAGIIAGIGLTLWTRNGAFLFIPFIAWGIKKFMLGSPKSAFSQKFKEQMVPLIVKFFGDFQYGQDVTPPENDMRSSGLFGTFNRMRGDDYISGNYKGTGFTFSEVLLQYHSSGGRRHRGSTRTVFNGMIMYIDLKKSFAGQTIVKRDSQKGLWSWLTGTARGLKNVKIENPEFEKIFEVYSSDENEAAALVSPDFIQKLMLLNAAYPSNAIRCCFMGGKLMLAISYGGNEAAGKLFEVEAFEKSLADMKEIHKFLAQMNVILQIIEVVNPPKAGSVNS